MLCSFWMWDSADIAGNEAIALQERTEQMRDDGCDIRGA